MRRDYYVKLSFTQNEGKVLERVAREERRPLADLLRVIFLDKYMPETKEAKDES